MAKTVNLDKFIKVYRKSEIIVEENSKGEEMYIVSSGGVRLTTTAPGREVLLATLGPGDFFGEMSLVDTAPRTATATASEDNTRLVTLDQQRFLYLVSQQPAFALTIMHELCQRIRNRWTLYEKLFAENSKTELSAH
jgi:CRP/FNR family transcriptional regulator, cyclic AMP receptor protein